MHRRMMRGHEEVITGEELRQLIVGKWGRSYDVRLQRRGSKVYLHVMWKHLEQRSFHLTAAQYQQQLDAVAEYLQVRHPATFAAAVLCCLCTDARVSVVHASAIYYITADPHNLSYPAVVA